MQFTHLLSRTGRDIFAKKLNCVSNTRNPCVVSASAVSCFNVPYSQNLCQLYLYIGLKNFSMFRSYSFRYVPVHSSTCFNVLTKSMLIVFVIVMGTLLSRTAVPFFGQFVVLPCIPQPQPTTTIKRRTRTHTIHSADKIWSKIAYRSCYLRVLHNIRNPNSKTSANRDLNE